MSIAVTNTPKFQSRKIDDVAGDDWALRAALQTADANANQMVDQREFEPLDAKVRARYEQAVKGLEQTESLDKQTESLCKWGHDATAVAVALVGTAFAAKYGFPEASLLFATLGCFIAAPKLM